MNVHFRYQLIVFALACSPLWGQVRKLHTRDMTRLSQVQVADYLKRSDIIFIPVGAVETNGIMPSDRDYVSPLAYAMTMADGSLARRPVTYMETYSEVDDSM